MAHAVAHILIAIIIMELIAEHIIKDKTKLPKYYLLIAAIGGVFPDFDVALTYIMYFFGFAPNEIHRTFLHTIFIPIIFLAIGLLVFYSGKKGNKNYAKSKKKTKTAAIFFILAGATLVHLLIDSLTGTIMPFYPLSYWQFGINLVNIIFPPALQPLVMPTLDGILLLAWLFWIELKVRARRIL